ncbi:MAG: type II toxin-antitoxin system prevent-host-death family antitoxin [Burkholderiaceae bacterium]|jgi:prevent-host-death family protein|nr:type II toxin-antitoxin system prevent-host-death family antitoxin [Burkholderiaceae bacterium]
METLGIEATRRRLPELVAAAHEGKTTVITRHGRPYAAIVPVQKASERRPPTAILALRGCAAGLWGEEPARLVEALRGEWAE